uniref:Uncharacterized protein n=1 Tax=viral metagenome TaxID=1070528 RepID=A0A6C0DJY1_9ZZZZ
MTLINNIEIDDIQYKRNIIKEAILNNDPIEDKLHVVLTISNPCLYARRYILIKEMMNRLELEETDVIVYVVELAYKKQRFIITDSKNPRHLQIRTETPIWHKENMINLGIQKLLPKNWKAVAWIDSDLEFENISWAKDTLKVLNGTKDIVQIFSHCVDMNKEEEAMSVFVSFGYQYVKGLPYRREIKNFWHPGYAWACTRKAYEKMGGLYECAILGSADNVMALSLIQQGLRGINEKSTDDYKDSVLRYQNRVKTLRLGYVPGVLRHYFHGSKENRKYGDRWKILLNHNFSPREHLTHDENGILIPTPECPREMLDEILNYFKERNEDSCYQKDKPNQIQLNANEFLAKPDIILETKTEKHDEIESETESDMDMESINERMMVMFNINSIHEAIDKVLGIE